MSAGPTVCAHAPASRGAECDAACRVYGSAGQCQEQLVVVYSRPFGRRIYCARSTYVPKTTVRSHQSPAYVALLRTRKLCDTNIMQHGVLYIGSSAIAAHCVSPFTRLASVTLFGSCGGRRSDPTCHGASPALVLLWTTRTAVECKNNLQKPTLCSGHQEHECAGLIQLPVLNTRTLHRSSVHLRSPTAWCSRGQAVGNNESKGHYATTNEGCVLNHRIFKKRHCQRCSIAS